MTWVESGDAFASGKYDAGTVAPSVVAGYTAAEAAALVVDPLPPGASYQTHPDGYVTHGLSFAPGHFLRLGGLNVEDPPGFPQFPQPDDPTKFVAPWAPMPDRRPLRGLNTTDVHGRLGTGGALYAAVIKVSAFAGAICLWRGYALTHTAYARGASWDVVRTPLVSFWLHGDGSVSVRRSPSDGTGGAEGVIAGEPSADVYVTKTATGQPAQSLPGAVPFGQWVRLQIGITLDSVAEGTLGEGRLGVRVDTTEVLGGLTSAAGGGWTINPAPGAPPSEPGDARTATPGLGLNAWDAGALAGSTGTVVLRDLVLAEAWDRWLTNWGVTHVVPTLDHTQEQIDAYNADTATNHIKYVDSHGQTVDTGYLRRRPWRQFALDGTLANRGSVLDTGALDLQQTPDAETVWRGADDAVHLGPAQAGDRQFLGTIENHQEDRLRPGEGRLCVYEYGTAALATALGWEPSLSGVEWADFTAATDQFTNDREDQHFVTLWPEQFWLDEVPRHTVNFWWGIWPGQPYQLELTQSRRDEKQFRYGYDYFRGQAGTDDAPQTICQAIPCSAPGQSYLHVLRTDASRPMLHLQSQLSAGACQADVLHESAIDLTPPADLTAYVPPPFQSLQLLLVDSFGHYEGGCDADGSATGALRADGHLGGATTYGASRPCYGFAQYGEYGARSAKWPTAFATNGGVVEIVRPGRDGADGALRVVGTAGVCRSLADVDARAPYELQLGFHWRAETAGAGWDTDYVRLLTLYQLGDLSSWPPQLQLTLEVDREGYLHVNRPGAAASIATSPAVELLSTLPLGNGDLTAGAYVELRVALDAQTEYPGAPGFYASTVNGYLLFQIDDQDAGSFANVPVLLDPLDTLNAAGPNGDNPRGSGTDFVVLGDDLLYPGPAHTVAGRFDDLYLAELVDSTPVDARGVPTADPGSAADPQQLPADFFGDLRVTPLLPVATTEDGGGWTLAGAATAHETVNQALPDGDTTTLTGPAGASRLLWQYPHVPEPSELEDGAESQFKRFVGFQAFAVGRAEGATAGAGGLTRPVSPMAQPALYSPAGTMGTASAPGPIPWKVWHQTAEQLTVAPFVFWQPGIDGALEYGLTAQQFNALRIGPQSFAGCPDVVLTQWGVEVLAALPRRPRARSWAFLLG